MVRIQPAAAIAMIQTLVDDWRREHAGQPIHNGAGVAAALLLGRIHKILEDTEAEESR